MHRLFFFFFFFSAVFCIPSFAALIATEFPHLIIPLLSNTPDAAYGTQYDAMISYSPSTFAQHYTEISFDVPSNDATSCRLAFHVNTDPSKNAPFSLSGQPPYLFNISRLEPTMDKDTDSWNSYPGITDHVATYSVDHSGAVVTRNSKWFACPKGQVAQFLMTPASNRDFDLYWYELDYPDNEGGPHGVTLEMWTF